MESSTPSLFFLGGNLNTIYLLVGYNNYYNRQLKKLATVQQYLQAAQQYYQINDVVNFNPADGISTKHIFNFQVYDLEGPEPDYMIVVNNDTIEQRWFVLDGDRTRAGQYEVSLYRDTVAEQWQNIGNLPMFVEKAIVAQNDPAIFNSESMSFNQIKQSETLLKDITGCAWVVGYMTQDNVLDEQQIDIPLGDVETYNTLEDYPYYKYVNRADHIADEFITEISRPTFTVNVKGDSNTERIVFTETTGDYYTSGGDGRTGLQATDSSLGNDYSDILPLYSANPIEKLKEKIGFRSSEEIEAFKKQTSKKIYIKSTNAVYTVTISQHTVSIPKTRLDVLDPLFIELCDTLYKANGEVDFIQNPGAANNYSFLYSVNEVMDTLVMHQITNNLDTFKISNTRNRLSDQPYSMFCMPYGTTSIDSFIGTGTRDWSGISMKIARSISQKFGGADPALYDLQLLPYCPCRYMIDTSNEHLELDRGSEGVDYDYIKNNGTNVGIIFWCKTSSDTFNIYSSITVSDYKIDNETKMQRIVSPNYNGVFEFNAAKNGGVGSFNVDFTYKPYQPYIHVNPVFGRLYGQDFDDARGLICGGKFDLPQTSDAWAVYERQNTNYNAIFNRQIENLELQNEIGREADVVQAVAGSIQGAGAGASMGAAGGPYGAIAGGIVGGAASLWAGITDVQINDKLRNEVMDYRKDMFGFNLRNIGAQPDSLVSVGALNKNNKLFPFLEKYDCTTEERNALINKIRFNGMTVGRIGTINEFVNNTWSYSNGWNYIKGQLIRLPIWGDTHYIATLASEMEKGIFVEV